MEPGGAKEPGGEVRTTVPSEAERASSQGRATGSEDRGGAHGSTLQSRAGNRKPQGGSGLHGRADGGAEGIERASGGGAEGMASSGGACRQRKLGEEAGLMKDRAGGDKEHSVIDRIGSNENSGIYANIIIIIITVCFFLIARSP